MKRKDFIIKCSYACLGASSVGVLLQSCVSTKSISAQIAGDNLIIPESDFKRNQEFVKYLIVTNDQLEFPIYVFRFSDRDYSALYLQCTHQGNEVNAYGEKLVCSAHGSEYDNRGSVTNGPASNPLRSFPVELKNQNLLISLKKV